MAKYQRPTNTFSGAGGLPNTTKYQDDAAAIPKVAISSSKIDGDFNYVIDALNEIDEASGTRASISDRLNVAMNADGTLKSSVAVSLDEWTEDTVASTILRVDNSSISIDSDVSAIYSPGRRVRLTIGASTYYADVAESNFAVGLTIIDLVDIVDESGSVAVIASDPSAIAYSIFTVDSIGNTPTDFPELKLRNDAPLLRLKDTGTSGTEYAIRCDAGKLDFLENSGTENSPNWTVRTSVNGSGVELANYSIDVVKLETNSTGELISWNPGGFPVKLDAGVSGDVLTSNGGSLVPAFTTVPPTGVIVPYAGASAPTGWLLCDGSTVSRTTYVNLFAIVGTTYGEGDGSTTFTLPDLRGRTVFGLDNMGGSSAGRLSSANTLGLGGGSQTKSGVTDGHALTEAQIPAHTHAMGEASGTDSSDASSGTIGNVDSSATNDPSGFNFTTQSTGSDQAHSHTITNFNVVPPYLLLNYLIKV